MRKRGQITVFIALGITILISFSLVIYITAFANKNILETGIKNQNDLSSDTSTIEIYITDCLKTVTNDALFLINQHGGYLTPSGNPFYKDNGTEEFNSSYTFYQTEEIPLYIKSANITFPTIDSIKEKLEHYIIVELQNCLKLENFEIAELKIKEPDVNFQDFGYIDTNKSYSIVNIKNDYINVKAYYPVTLSTSNSQTKLEYFEIFVPVRLQNYYNIANNITNTSSLLYLINDSWDTATTFNLNTLTCNDFDQLNQTIIKSFFSNDAQSMIIQIIDAYRYNETNEFDIFQFAVNKFPLDFLESECT